VLHHEPVTSDGLEQVWRPLGFDGEEAASYDSLVDGVPSWMAESFWNWVRPRVAVKDSNGWPVLNRQLVHEIERVCRISCGYAGSEINKGMAALRRAFEGQARSLQLADFLLSRTQSGDPTLDRVLHESGSAWRVGVRAGRPGLVRRVPEGVQVAVDAVTAGNQRAGSRLGEAWAAAFGLSPDPSRAYALAVKAVEDAAIPVVTPRDTSATLGKVLQVMRDQGDWVTPVTREHPRASSSEVLVGMMQMLWTGQSDRHGGGEAQSVPVTQDAAETAVLLAVPLVQWFTGGLVRRGSR
jgi:hypothetical protein